MSPRNDRSPANGIEPIDTAGGGMARRRRPPSAEKAPGRGPGGVAARKGARS